jgi:hypothetical protein
MFRLIKKLTTQLDTAFNFTIIVKGELGKIAYEGKIRAISWT